MTAKRNIRKNQKTTRKKPLRTMSLRALIKNAIEGKTNNKAIHTFFTVSKSTVNFVKEETGLDITGYKHAIDNYSIKHAILEHGDEVKEAERGQLPVTLDKFFQIPLIIKKPDERIIEERNGKYYIKYIKKFKNTFYYVEEILTGRKLLSTMTLYIKKSSTPKIKKSRKK